MEQFLTGDVWSQVNKHLKKKQSKIVCIAYVTSDSLALGKGDILICDASEAAIKFGETSAKTIKSYYDRGVNVYSSQSLHAKFLLTDSFLVIGSANLSKSSAERLTESSILTSSSSLISQAKAFSHNLIQESTLLNEKSISQLLEIKVVRQPFKNKGKSKVRSIKFGDQCWFIPSFELSERAYDKVRGIVEKTTKEVSKKNNIAEDEIDFLRWKGESKFSKIAKEGDQIILRLNNKDKTRSYVYPPSTILKKEVADGYTYIYHDSRNAEKQKMSWTKFQAFLKNLNLGKTISNRTVVVLKDDFEKLITVWKK